MELDAQNQWTHYFSDTNHGTIGLHRYFVKGLPFVKRKLIEREYRIQKILSHTRLAPEPYFKFISPVSFLPSFIIEERIDFYPKYPNDSSFIIEVGKSLRAIHEESRSKRKEIHKYIPPNRFLVDGVYNPVMILWNFIEKPFKKIYHLNPHLVNDTAEQTIEEIGKRIRGLLESASYKSEYCSLIHGDLNDTNVVRRIGDKKIVYLDWVDARWDIVSCDVSQFIYLHGLTDQEKISFLKAYNCEWITEPILEIHRLLLIGWEIVYLMTVDLKPPLDKSDRLSALKRLIWDEGKIPL